ncbi:flavin reductase family protein [Pseudohalocynthiibacter sp. F2068]|jgi:flavin reductase (DIM6/NTAB) family NADH-FMN oxidoreductase RutF|uniref:flavin reductase family protein n=1 Tax=Pseudohalocynthiibacter sp. F2068 TaxID=2926418 RepID=UPI001FF58290|nr:flavin reductase family protein [Pseudohalocynthiibacter sp. F2068]MCK0103938.1 flavin reductase family protein [Pseudohalocynthiibacter sp. F2068]
MRQEFIDAMRRVASSVTVVTTNGSYGRVGATVSAFSSLTADPPSVLVCLKTDSRIAQTVLANNVYCVNVLPEGADELAQRFAGQFDSKTPDRFENLSIWETDGNGPGLVGATVFACNVEKCVEHGSHTIFIGGVTQIFCASDRPLTYLNGAYHQVRPQSKPEEE